eukprot:gb/GECG01016663.1/.p1 GENE.gb/GECG01016663.1/~~gb/GECG01016663.1/.p1  ORF type:complete len:220 (+),score=22.68 gb/GECG01016663.1/:1-660(+)
MERKGAPSSASGTHTFCGQALVAWKPKTLSESFERIQSTHSVQSLTETALHFLENPCSFCQQESSETEVSDDYAICLAAVSQLLQVVGVRQPSKQTLHEELERLASESLMPQQLAEGFGKIAHKLNLDAIRSSRLAPIPGSFSRVKDVRWRLDVVISTDAAKKVLRPSILLEFTIGDGKLVRTNLSMQQFHHLRYTTAKTLKEMEIVREHPLMKLLIEK